MKPTFTAHHILMGWPRATAGVTLSMLLAGCPANQPDDSDDATALLEAWTGDCASFPATQTTIQFVITRNMNCGAVFATRGP